MKNGKLLQSNNNLGLRQCSAITPDEKTLISGCNSSAITFSTIDNTNINDYNIENIESRLEGHNSFINAIALNADGSILASGSMDNTVKLWNIKNRQELHTFVGHSGFVESVAFSPDGRVLASGSWDKTVKLWEVNSGKEIKTLKGYDSGVRTVLFSPDGKTLASGGNDNSVKLWNLNTIESPKTLFGFTSPVVATLFDSNGKQFTAGSLGIENRIKKWSLTSNNDLESFRRPKNVSTIAFSPDGKFSAIGGNQDGSIEILDLRSGNVKKTVPGTVFFTLFSPDSKVLAYGCDEGKVKLFNIETEQENYFECRGSIYSMSFSRDGRLLVTGGDFGIELWDIENRVKLQTFSHLSSGVVSISPDNKTLASTENAALIKLWDLDSGKIILTLLDQTWINSLAFNLNSDVLVSGSAEGIKLFNLTSGREIVRIIPLNKNDWAIITPDGRFDASEGALKLMHYTYGLEIINLEQLKEMYYEPGLLQKLLGYSKEPLRPIVPLSDVKLYPEVVEQTVAPNSTKLTIKLKNRGGGIGAVQVFVGNEFGNKLAVEDARDAKLKQNPNVPEATLTVDLQGTGYLKGKPNKITVVTSNYLKEIGKGNIQSRGTEIVWLAGGQEEEYKLPTLYAIVGGVSDYAGENLDLRFAAKDAEDFSNALSLGAKRLFCDKANPNCIDKVNITTLSTSGNAGTILPTKENFIKAFREVAAKAKPEDIVVIYLAGHGVSFGVGTDSYFYLTQEARTTSREDLAKVLTTSAISSDELSDWLTPNTQNADDIFIKAGKQVIILDTCASGNAAEKLALSAKRDLSGDQIRAIEFLKDKTGTFVLMASTADAPSYEASAVRAGFVDIFAFAGDEGRGTRQRRIILMCSSFSPTRKRKSRRWRQISAACKNRSCPRRWAKHFIIGQMTDAETKQINLPSPKPLNA